MSPISDARFPKTWEIAEVGEIAQINPGLDKSEFDDQLEVTFVPMPAVEAETGRIDVSTCRKFGEVKKGYTAFRKGDVLFAKITPCMENGKMAVVPQLRNELGFGSTEFHVLRPRDDISAKYLYHFVSAQQFRRDAEHNMTGAVGQRRVPMPYLARHPIPVPPALEQQRIVAKIEELFSELDKGVESLTTAREQLKTYRQSVLKVAFEGKLTEDWRNKDGSRCEPVEQLLERISQPPRPNRWNSRTTDVILGHPALAVGNPKTKLPDGWRWCQLADIARMESGHTPSRERAEWWGGDVAWIGIADARENDGRVIHETFQHTNADGLANSAARLLPAGTVCISRTASVGYVVVMGKSMATSQDFVNWTPTEAVTSDWLRTVFGADKESLRRFGKGTVHKTIYFPEWLSVHIALPPLEEQKVIVAEIDKLLSSIEYHFRVVDEALAQAVALRQSILKRAFSGQLVPQDPADEPASVLLARIRAERKVNGTTKRPNTKNGKKEAA